MMNKCPYCNQEFTGVNNLQSESQLKVHLVTKHADKVEIVEIDDQSKKEVN